MGSWGQGTRTALRCCQPGLPVERISGWLCFGASESSPGCLTKVHCPLTAALPSRTFTPLNPRFLHGNIVQTGLFALSSPSLKPGFRGKQNLLHEGKIGFSVFSIHVWSSHFPASPPLIAVELHFMEKWNFLILSWICHLPCVGVLAGPVLWISLHPNNHCCPELQICCFEQ